MSSPNSHYLDEATLSALEQATKDVWATLQARDPSHDWRRDSASRTALVEKLMDLMEAGTTDHAELYAKVLESDRMKSEPVLRVEVIDDEIVVILPKSSYSVTYYKPENSPQLLAKRISDKDDPRVPIALSDFLAGAWRAANGKARELGWIV